MTNSQASEILKARIALAEPGSDLRTALSKGAKALKDMDSIRARILELYGSSGWMCEAVDTISCQHCPKHGMCEDECVQSDEDAVDIFMAYLTGETNEK